MYVFEGKENKRIIFFIPYDLSHVNYTFLLISVECVYRMVVIIHTDVLCNNIITVTIDTTREISPELTHTSNKL